MNSIKRQIVNLSLHYSSGSIGTANEVVRGYCTTDRLLPGMAVPKGHRDFPFS